MSSAWRHKTLKTHEGSQFGVFCGANASQIIMKNESIGIKFQNIPIAKLLQVTDR
jgi:hypothetical protein